MNKGITLSQVENACKWAVEAGIKKVTYSLMLGIPGDSKETIIKTIEFGKNLQKKYGVRIVVACTVCYPGTFIFSHPLRSGVIKIREKDYDKYNTDNPIMDLKDISADEIRCLWYDAVKIFTQDTTSIAKMKEEVEKSFKMAFKIQKYFFGN